jgi:hypothetical protein
MRGQPGGALSESELTSRAMVQKSIWLLPTNSTERLRPGAPSHAEGILASGKVPS